MGRKTVRWNQLQNPQNGFSSCNKCDSCGIIQEYDYDSGHVNYIYCDCYFGKQELEKFQKQQDLIKKL